MSFNRPRYLRPVLESLNAQTRGSLEGREVHLFQDGAVNRYSGLRYAEDTEIWDSIELFKRYFPEGIVHHSQHNIGICESFKRAEEFAFLERGFECAYFFEDDLVLSPVYIDMMEALQRYAETMGNIAYFAAYGDIYVPQEDLQKRRCELTTLDHHWAFGLLRRHWLKINESIQDYYRLVVGGDYARRDTPAIFASYRKYGGAPRASSQDARKAFACAQLGLWRANTVTSFSRYIGAAGLHMRPELYESLGYGKAFVSQSAVTLNLLDENEVQEHIQEQVALFQNIYRNELQQLIDTAPSQKLSPARPSTREDVIGAYRLLLHKGPESEDLITRNVNVAVGTLIRRFLSMRSVGALGQLNPQRPSTRDDIIVAYQLLLHRNPESDSVILRNVNTAIETVVSGLLQSSEFEGLMKQTSDLGRSS
jgi:hypothetical protein